MVIEWDTDCLEPFYSFLIVFIHLLSCYCVSKQEMTNYPGLPFCKQMFMSVSLSCSAAIMSQRSIKHKLHNGSKHKDFFSPNLFEFRKRQPGLICLLKHKVSILEDIGCHSFWHLQSTLIGHAVGLWIKKMMFLISSTNAWDEREMHLDFKF